MRKFTALLLAILMFASFSLAPLSAKADHNPLHDIAVTATGTLNGVAGTFTGDMDITRFVRDNGQVGAIGTLVGEFVDVNNVTTAINTTFSSLIDLDTTEVCDILNLEIGAIHLDLLGLVLDIAPIDIELTAESGSGNLLGNLLCAITHLLDGPNPLGGVLGLLNNLLRALG